MFLCCLLRLLRSSKIAAKRKVNSPKRYRFVDDSGFCYEQRTALRQFDFEELELMWVARHHKRPGAERNLQRFRFRCICWTGVLALLHHRLQRYV